MTEYFGGLEFVLDYTIGRMRNRTAKCDLA
jgi:hypothetical protein